MGGEGASSSLSQKAMAVVQDREGDNWTWIITEKTVRCCWILDLFCRLKQQYLWED